MTSPPTLRDEFMTADVALVLYVLLGYRYESYLLVKNHYYWSIIMIISLLSLFFQFEFQGGGSGLREICGRPLVS